jgi:ubiquinone/menaquinone biosynthesis C-methylase UbiE
MDGYEARTYGDRYADVYDDWYGDDGGMALTTVGTPTDVANRIDDLAGGGPVLELGVGTGRLALTLADHGLEVTGLDASGAMLDRLRTKPGSERLTLVEGDMAAPPGLADGTFAVVLVGFNTFFNLTNVEAQAACMASAARLLRMGGRLVVEAFVFDPEKAHDGVSTRLVELDRVLLDVVQFDEAEQVITGQRIEISAAGNRLFPYVLRYASPDQMDDMATAAGLRLEDRSEDWHGATFDDSSPAHVSVWSKP